MDKESYKLLLKLLLALLLSVGVFCCESFSAPKEPVKKVAQVQKTVSKSVKEVAKQAKVPAKNVATQKTAQKNAPAKANTKVAVAQKNPVKRLPTLTKSTMFVKPTSDNNKKNPPKKKVKTKSVVVDCKLVAFARTASDAEAAADALAVSVSSGKLKPLIKDAVFMTDSTGRVACLKRMNYTDQIPENWYLETQMVVGFSSISYERAYNDAVQRSSSKVKSIQEKNKNNKVSDENKNPSAQGAIAYDHVFAKSGKEYYCRLFFRYMMPKN